MTNFGIDVSTFPDLDKSFTPYTGQRVIAEAILRRLLTPRGGLAYDLDYGLDVRAWLNEDFTPRSIYLLQTQIEAECEKDERVFSAATSVSFDPSAFRLTIALTIETRDDTFRLTLAIDQVSAAILAIQ